MNNRLAKRTFAAGLAALLLFGQAAPSFAAQTPSPKEEVVYINLQGNGDVKEVYVVNSFDGGDILDYGDYSSIKNMTTNDEISQDGDKITVQTEEDKLYYQGTLDNAQIPWNMDVHYYMDGEEFDIEEIAGKSGALEITLDITQNENCKEDFWKAYALQITMKLDSEKCTNIVSENATIANVGSLKQLTYIVLPGKGANIKVNADVEDFEMEAIALNGMSLNLNIELDSSVITEKLGAIESAVSQLDDGSGQLKNGASTLYKGAGDLNEGAKTLDESLEALQEGIAKIQKGVKKLNKKSDDLTSGSSQVYDALTTIQSGLSGVKLEADSLKELSSASTKVQNGIDSIVKGLETIDEKIDLFYDTLKENGISDVDELIEYHEQLLEYVNVTQLQRDLYSAYESDGNSGVIRALSKAVSNGNSEAEELYNSFKDAGFDKDILVDYVTTAGMMVTIEKLVNADIKYFEGTDALIGGIGDTLDETNKDGLMAGTKELQKQYKVFDSAIQSMVTSLESLITNMVTLKEGIDKLVENYEALDSGINAYTKGVAQIEAGYSTLYTSVAAISQGTSKLYKGTSELVDGTLELYQGTVTLNNGTGEFASKTDGMEGTVSDTVEETIDKMTGRTVQTGSFVSDKNTNVESVLFVIKTPPVSKTVEAVEEVVEEKELTLWQKILKLFGIE